MLAKVMLLQSLEGTSSRETVDRVRRDIGWKVALGLSLQDEGFHPTVLTYFRERLRKSAEPRRIFDRFKQVATEAGLLTTRGVRVLDSTPVLSAVQTQDTVSLIKGAIRRLLTLLAKTDATIKAAIEAALHRDDYARSGKPAIDWDDEASRSALVDELVRDALAALGVLEGKELSGEVADAAELLATVAGQDVYEDDDGNFRIRKGVAKDRIISVVDPDARHGHKSKSRHFDGYQAHVAFDPETELVTEIEVAPGSTHEAELSRDLLPELDEDDAEVTVVADSAYGSGTNLKALQDAGTKTIIKVQRDKNSWGGFPKSAFAIDLEARTATCPAGVTTNNYISYKDGGGAFRFPTEACASCALRSQCTSATSRGRSITFGPHEQLLSETRVFQQTKEFKAIYNTKRPTVERVIYRMVRNGGRKARYRGRVKVGEQIRLKAASENIVRMLRLGLVWTADTRWALA